MPLTGEYEPSTSEWVRDQVEAFEASDGREANTLMDTGMPIVVVTNRGASSGKLRKTPVMKVEHDGVYAMVASQGGAPTHPLWYNNLKADPNVEVHDVGAKTDMVAREIDGDERTTWWDRAVEAYPGLRRLSDQDRPGHPGVPAGEGLEGNLHGLARGAGVDRRSEHLHDQVERAVAQRDVLELDRVHAILLALGGGARARVDELQDLLLLALAVGQQKLHALLARGAGDEAG